MRRLTNLKPGEKTMTTMEEFYPTQTARSAASSQRKIAAVAGYSLLLMTLFTLSAEVFALQNIIVPGDAAATTNNITTNPFQFRLGIVCHLVVIVFDLVAAWAIYVYLKPLNNGLSLLTAWSRLIYTTFYGIGLVNYYRVFQLLSGVDYLSVFDTPELQAQVMLAIQAFRDVWAFGYIFFGLHLAFLGVIVFKSGFIPRIIGALLILAGVSYLIEYLGKFLFPDFDTAIAMIFGWGEAIFMLWLIFKGARGAAGDE